MFRRGFCSPRPRRSESCSLAAPVVGAQDETENSLSSVSPADGDTLSASPAELVFTFTRELGADHKLTAPVSCDTQPQNTGVPQIGDNDERIVTVEILTPLPRGGCSVAWVLRDELDQTITEGRFAFSVQNDPPVRRRPKQLPRHRPSTTVPVAAAVDGRRQPGQHRRRRVARPSVVDARHHDHLRRPRADRRRLARGARVRDHGAVLALDVGVGADRDRAVPRRVHRRRDRPIARRLAQPVGVVRPRRCRLARAGGDRPPRPRHRHWLGGDATRAGHRPDHAVARVRHPVARHRGRRAESDGRRLPRDRCARRHRSCPGGGGVGGWRGARRPCRVGRAR